MPETALGPFPSETSVEQLIWLIHATAGGQLNAAEFVDRFRQAHEKLEAQGRIRYTSKDQARLIWDVLWDLEYYSPDPNREETPGEWHSADEVLKSVKRVAARLAEL